MSGQGNRPIDITLPDRPSENARASIPDHAVPRIAAAMRAQFGDQPNGQPDDEYVADKIMEHLRQIAVEHEYSEAIRAAHMSVPRPEPDF